MLQYQFLGNALVRSTVYQQYQLLGFHPDGPGIHTIPPRHVFSCKSACQPSAAFERRERKRRGRPGALIVQSDGDFFTGHRFSPPVQTTTVATTPAKFVSEILSRAVAKPAASGDGIEPLFSSQVCLLIT